MVAFICENIIIINIAITQIFRGHVLVLWGQHDHSHWVLVHIYYQSSFVHYEPYANSSHLSGTAAAVITGASNNETEPPITIIS